MTFGKLKELLDCMSESQLKKEVIAQDNEAPEAALHIKDVRILFDQGSGDCYPALVA